MGGSTFTLNLDGVTPWLSPADLRRRLAKMQGVYDEAEVPSLVEQRRGEAELAELNAPLQEAWQREREATHRRARRHLVAHAISTAIAKATAHVGRHRRASGGTSPRRRGSRRSSSPGSDDDGGGSSEPASRGLSIAGASR